MRAQPDATHRIIRSLVELTNSELCKSFNDTFNDYFLKLYVLIKSCFNCYFNNMTISDALWVGSRWIPGSFNLRNKFSVLFIVWVVSPEVLWFFYFSEYRRFLRPENGRSYPIHYYSGYPF